MGKMQGKRKLKTNIHRGRKTWITIGFPVNIFPKGRTIKPQDSQDRSQSCVKYFQRLVLFATQLSSSSLHGCFKICGPSALELANLKLAYGKVNGDFSRVLDVNQPPNTPLPPCDVTPCINEHITLEMKGITGSSITEVWFNFYNSTFYNPTFAIRQWLLDTSGDPSTPFSFQDLFLKGPQTLAEFLSYRTPELANLTDAVLLSGPNGTVASGRFLRLEAVPAPLPFLGGGVALAWTRRLKQRNRKGRNGMDPAPSTLL